MTSRSRAGNRPSTGRPRPPRAVRRTWVNALTNSTRNTLLTPTVGYRARIVRIWAIITPPELNSITLELYFGTGTDATTNRAKLIDQLRTGTAAGTIQGRTYDTTSVGRAPTGEINEVVSYRWGSTPALDHDHRIIIEYIEELLPGRAA